MSKITTDDISTLNSLDEGRVITNNNFKIVSNSLNNIQNMVDSDTKTISNITNLKVFTTSNPNIPSAEKLITTNGIVEAKGGIRTDDSVYSKSNIITGDSESTTPALQVQKGDVMLGNKVSTTTIKGGLQLDGRMINVLSVRSGAHNETSYITPPVEIVGSDKVAVIPTNDAPMILLDFTGYSNSGHISRFRLSTIDAIQGQSIKIIVKKTATPTNIIMMTNNIICPTLASQANFGGVYFTNNYQSVDLVYDGQNWIMTDAFGVTIHTI